MIKLLAAIVLVFSIQTAVANDSEQAEKAEQGSVASMDDYVTCAVYYRMVVGSLSSHYGAGREELTVIPKENMATMMGKAKQIAEQEYGKDLGEELFADAWRDIYKEMTDRINRNFDNVTRLKYMYDKRCLNLGGKSARIGVDNTTDS